MDVTWLGQAGFLLERGGKKILIDPYLSDACAANNPAAYRRVPVDGRYLALKPDVIVLTHDHADHTDPETLRHYLPGAGGVLVLAAAGAWERVRAFGGGNNYVRFCSGTRWSWEGVTFTAVPAEHSDPTAIGVVVDDGDKKYYFTGDTLYNQRIFQALPEDLYAVFLPINGRGNNMNCADAAAFAARAGAVWCVPVHFGLLDEIDPTGFSAENRIIPKIYKSVFGEESI